LLLSCSHTFRRDASLLSSCYLNDPAPREIYTLSLHDALPISSAQTLLQGRGEEMRHEIYDRVCAACGRPLEIGETCNCQQGARRSEEHTSELQSRFDLVCRLLLEKKKSESKYLAPFSTTLLVV